MAPSRLSAALQSVAKKFWENDKLAAVSRATGLAALYRAVQNRLDPPRVTTINILGEEFKFWTQPQTHIYEAGYDYFTAAELARHIRPGSVVLDAGAHHGYFTLFCARRVGPEGLVVAFEPGPEHQPWLRRNVELNGLTNVRIVEAAVGAKPGVTRFAKNRVYGQKGVDVKVVTLDDTVAQLGIPRVDAVKIDVEGFESEVLEGASRVLAMRPGVVVEVHPQFLEPRGIDASRPLDLLRQAGYGVFVEDPASKDYGVLPFTAPKPHYAVYAARPLPA